MHQPEPTFQVNGPAVRAKRMSLGISITGLARAAGVTNSYLSRIEVGTATGRMRPGTYTALRDHLTATDEELLVPPEGTPTCPATPTSATGGPSSRRT